MSRHTIVLGRAGGAGSKQEFTGAESEWQDAALGEVLDIEHGYAFKGEHFRDAGTDVLLTPKNFRSRGGLDVSPSRCKYYDGPLDARWVLKAGDVVVAMTDLKQTAPILGAAGVVPSSGRYLHNQRIGRVVVRDSGRLAREFVPWLLNSPAVRARVRETATGATVRHTAPVRIAEARARLPSLRTQLRIAAVLRSFDDLIAINLRRIEILEELARSLYREWFERRRLNGRQAVRWSVRNLFEIADVGFGFSFKSKGFGPTGSHAVVRIRDVPAGATATFTDEPVADRYSVRDGDVLIGMDGDFHLNRWSGGEAWLNQRVARLRPKPGTSGLHLQLAIAAPISQLNQTITGTTVAHLGKRHLEQIDLPLPTGEALARATAAFEAIGAASLGLRQHVRRAAATRDLLLPRLVTGRLDISAIDLGALLADSEGE
jgi:type I restriction enzyme S subunit